MATPAPFDPASFHASARALFECWQAMHPAHGLPGRQHFDPGSVVELLPNIVLVDVHREPLRFRYRLLGSGVDSIQGRSLSGLWLDEAYAGAANGAVLIDEYTRVATTGTPRWWRGPPRVVPFPGCRLVEVLRLPLASDGTTVDMVLGMALYFDQAGLALDDIALRTLGYRAGQPAEARGVARKREPPPNVTARADTTQSDPGE